MEFSLTVYIDHSVKGLLNSHTQHLFASCLANCKIFLVFTTLYYHLVQAAQSSYPATSSR